MPGKSLPNLRRKKSSIGHHARPSIVKNPYKRTKKNTRNSNERSNVVSVTKDSPLESSKTKNDPEKELHDQVDDLLLDAHLNEKNELSNCEYDNIESRATEEILEIGEDEGLTTSSRKMYLRYQNKWKQFVEKKSITNEYDDIHLKAFFIEMRSAYAPSTMWVIYSCINRYFIVTYGKNLKNLSRLQMYLKIQSQRYVSTKSKVFSPEQIHTVLMHCLESQCPEFLLVGVGVSLLYFGLLRSRDVLKVTVEDVTLNSDGKYEVRFEHLRKRKNSGFTYTIPKIYSDLFKKYIEQIDIPRMKTNRFLKNYNVKGMMRFQNCGQNKVNKWHKVMCYVLGVDETGYTSHCFRRSAATNLADAGVSFINLKRHGQWQCDAVVEGYIANSKPMRVEREQNLLPESLRDGKMVILW